MGFASRHNLLYPENPDGSEMHQPTDVPGGTLTSALDRDGVILLSSDNAQAWAPGLFATNIRRVLSPVPDLYLLDDEVTTADSCAVSFLLHSACPMQRRNS